VLIEDHHMLAILKTDMGREIMRLRDFVG